MIAIIPARGGSKGLPGKNLKILSGKPLLQYTADSAMNSKYISRIILSTDDELIAKAGKDCGVEVPFMRPAYLASDDSLAIDTYNFTIKELEKMSGQLINDIIILQPTSPLRLSEDIDNAIELYFDKKADSVISYTKEIHPVHWHKYLTKEMKFEELFLEHMIENRQSLRTTYYPNGSIFIFKKSLLSDGKYYSENSYAYLMPRERSVDIDNIDDFDYAEYLISKKNYELK